MAGVSRSAWHYRSSPRVRVAEPVPHKNRAYPSRISDADRAVVGARITAGWADGHSVDHSFASSWDDGVMLASRRSWWRIAHSVEDQPAPPGAPPGGGNRDRTPR